METALAMGLLLAFAAGLVAAAHIGGGSRGLRRPRVLVLWATAALVALLGIRILLALLAGSGPVPRAGRAEAILDLDAEMPTRALPACRAASARAQVLYEAGAHPRLDPEGTSLWFDAETEVGRQVYRLELGTRTATCWTCEEPGNNTRPYPGRIGLVFETDRHAAGPFRTNTEVHFMRRLGDGPQEPSRRLTRSPGPDDHALLAPGGGRLVWSHGDSSGYQVVWAPIKSAHGALLLGGETTLARGGGDWLAPAEWSPDARALVLLGGNPFSAHRAVAIDFGAGASVELHRAVSRGGVAFSADGGVVALAGTRHRHPASWLPAPIASVFAPIATRLERGASLHRGTSLRIGPADAELAALSIPEVDDWGAPTGVSLSAAGTTLYLAQRSADGRERLVEIRRNCD